MERSRKFLSGWCEEIAKLWHVFSVTHSTKLYSLLFFAHLLYFYVSIRIIDHFHHSPRVTHSPHFPLSPSSPPSICNTSIILITDNNKILQLYFTTQYFRGDNFPGPLFLSIALKKSTFPPCVPATTHYTDTDVPLRTTIRLNSKI